VKDNKEIEGMEQIERYSHGAFRLRRIRHRGIVWGNGVVIEFITNIYLLSSLYPWKVY
jgi:hypothetical protein